MSARKPYALTRRGQRVKTLAQGLTALAVFYGAMYALARLSEHWLHH